MKGKKTNILRYCAKNDRITFRCLGIEKNEKAAAHVFDDFLLSVSKGNNVFLQTFKLSDISDIVDPETVISRADTLLDIDHSYFHLSEAKTKSESFADDTCCEAQFFFCKKDVKWEDFLVTSWFEKRKKLLKSGLVSAIFNVCDHGADLAFEADKIHEKKVFDLFEQLEKLDWQIEKVNK